MNSLNSLFLFYMRYRIIYNFKYLIHATAFDLQISKSKLHLIHYLNKRLQLRFLSQHLQLLGNIYSQL